MRLEEGWFLEVGRFDAMRTGEGAAGDDGPRARPPRVSPQTELKGYDFDFVLGHVGAMGGL